MFINHCLFFLLMYNATRFFSKEHLTQKLNSLKTYVHDKNQSCKAFTEPAVCGLIFSSTYLFAIPTHHRLLHEHKTVSEEYDQRNSLEDDLTGEELSIATGMTVGVAGLLFAADIAYYYKPEYLLLPLATSLVSKGYELARSCYHRKKINK